MDSRARGLLTRYRTRAGWVRDISLQWKLGLLVLAGLMLLFGLFVLMGELLTRQTASGMAAERLSVARLTAEFLDRQFEQQFIQLEWIAGQVDMRSVASSEEPELWADLARTSQPMVSSIFLVDAAGTAVSPEPYD